MSQPLTESEVTAPRSRSSAGWVLGVLFAGNLLDFYDRALPSVVLEPIKEEFGLDDTQVGVLASAFVLVAAVAGVPLGRLADRIPRTTVAGWGLVVWSAFTAAGGVLTSFWGFFASRVGVGIGESSYAPATGSLISDLYPSERRSRANSLFQLGFPIGRCWPSSPPAPSPSPSTAGARRSSSPPCPASSSPSSSCACACACASPSAAPQTLRAWVPPPRPEDAGGPSSRS